MAFGKKFIGSQMVHSACNESLRDASAKNFIAKLFTVVFSKTYLLG
jgi:hypothetical protein